MMHIIEFLFPRDRTIPHHGNLAIKTSPGDPPTGGDLTGVKLWWDHLIVSQNLTTQILSKDTTILDFIVSPEMQTFKLETVRRFIYTNGNMQTAHNSYSRCIMSFNEAIGVCECISWQEKIRHVYTALMIIQNYRDDITADIQNLSREFATHELTSLNFEYLALRIPVHLDMIRNAWEILHNYSVLNLCTKDIGDKVNYLSTGATSFMVNLTNAIEAHQEQNRLFMVNTMMQHISRSRSRQSYFQRAYNWWNGHQHIQFELESSIISGIDIERMRTLFNSAMMNEITEDMMMGNKINYNRSNGELMCPFCKNNAMFTPVSEDECSLCNITTPIDVSVQHSGMCKCGASLCKECIVGMKTT